jgi:hypothetical protein
MRLLLIAAALLSGVGAAAQPPTFAEVMRRAHSYVVQYEDHQLSSVMAVERYHQQWLQSTGQVKAERTLLSEFLIFQLPPDEDWFALRDVYDVDGKPVADRASVVERLRARSAESVTERAMEIARRSARFNLGDVYRTINVPTYPLRFLRPVSRKRFSFAKIGEEHIAGAATWVVTYEETERPTFSATVDGDDLPAQGRFWIEPGTGVIVRSEMIVGGSRRLRDRATVTVTYAPEPSRGFHVPVEMRERYDRPRQKTADVIVGMATYSNFRPFDSRTLMRSEPPAGDAPSASPPKK